MTTTPLLPTLADRVWFAYHCLPRSFNGAPISFRAVEAAHGLPNGTIQRASTGARKELTKRVFRLLAQALRVTETWLEFGGDGGPEPTVVPPRPGADWVLHRDLDGWHEAVIEAKTFERIPSEAFRAGAIWPVIRPCDRVTPELAIFVSGYAWEMSSPALQERLALAEARVATKAAHRPSRRRQGRSA